MCVGAGGQDARQMPRMPRCLGNRAMVRVSTQRHPRGIVRPLSRVLRLRAESSVPQGTRDRYCVHAYPQDSTHTHFDMLACSHGRALGDVRRNSIPVKENRTVVKEFFSSAGALPCGSRGARVCAPPPARPTNVMPLFRVISLGFAPPPPHPRYAWPAGSVLQSGAAAHK